MWDTDMIYVSLHISIYTRIYTYIENMRLKCVMQRMKIWHIWWDWNVWKRKYDIGVYIAEGEIWHNIEIWGWKSCFICYMSFNATPPLPRVGDFLEWCCRIFSSFHGQIQTSRWRKIEILIWGWRGKGYLIAAAPASFCRWWGRPARLK